MADPFWERFCTPLADRILQLVTGRGAAGAGEDAFIMEEDIAAVLGDGRYNVGGDVLRTKGKAALRVGQRVHVLWKRNARALILSHQWQRAQGGVLPTGVGYIEYLFIADLDGRLDVWFANSTIAGSLGVADLIEGTPISVRWGTKDNVFLVRGGEVKASRDTGALSHWYTFEFERPSRGAVLSSAPSRLRLLKTEHPWDTILPLATIALNGSFVCRTPTDEVTYSYEAPPPDSGLPPEESTSWQAGEFVSRSGTVSHGFGVSIEQRHFAEERMMVLGAELDKDNHLLMALSTNFATSSYYAPKPSQTLPGFRDHAVASVEVASLGAPDEIVSGNMGRVFVDCPDPLGAVQTILLDVTAGEILWRSCTTSGGVSRAIETTSAVGRASTRDHSVDGHSESAPGTGYRIDQTIERTPAEALPSQATSETRTGTDLVDRTLLEFLALPGPLTTSPTEAHQFWSFSRQIPESGPGAGGSGLYATQTRTSTYTWHSSAITLAIVGIDARRRDIFLFARHHRAIYSYAGGERNSTPSTTLWRINLATGDRVEIQPWKDDATWLVGSSFIDEGETHVFILGVSPSYVLWGRSVWQRDMSVPGSLVGKETWSIFLTHAIPGKPSLGTSTVLEASGRPVNKAGAFVYFPAYPLPAVAKFLNEENLQALWPDMVFYPLPDRLVDAWNPAGKPTLTGGGGWPLRSEVPAEATSVQDAPGPPTKRGLVTSASPSADFPYGTWNWESTEAWQALDNADFLGQYNIASKRPEDAPPPPP